MSKELIFFVHSFLDPLGEKDLLNVTEYSLDTGEIAHLQSWSRPRTETNQS